MTNPTPNTPGWTEGPWEAGSPFDDGDGDIIIIGEGPDRGAKYVEEAIAEVYRMNRTPDEFRANARLIAASPALYAALEAMVEAYWRGSEDSDDVDAPECVKLALAALNAANPERGGK